MKSTSGFHSSLRNDSQRAWVSLQHGLRTGTHPHTAGRHFPDQQMGTAGSGTGQQEAPTDRLPVQNFIEGMVKVKYQKCNLLVFHRACFSLKVPTQQLFITSFLLLEKLLGWHGNIFPPRISIPLPTFSSQGLRASLIPLHPFMPLLPIPYSFTWAFI